MNTKDINIMNYKLEETTKERLQILCNLFVTLPSVVYHGLQNNLLRYNNDELGTIHYNRTTTKKLILFVHGLGGGTSDFDNLFSNIKNMDNLLEEYNILSIRLSNSTIDDDANTLILDFIQDPSFDNIIIVGLSRGGLVATCAFYKLLISDNVAMNNNKNKIKKIITICSPLYGTKTCDLFSPLIRGKNQDKVDSLTDLYYQSDLCVKIATTLLENDCRIIYHIVPKYDHMIYPTDSSKYDFTSNSQIYTYDGFVYSHVGILYSKEVCDKIVDWILN